MLDSLLTTTKSGALWMVALCAVCLILDRGVSILFGQQEAFFLLLAAGSAAALAVTGTYTLVKLALHRSSSPKS